MRAVGGRQPLQYYCVSSFVVVIDAEDVWMGLVHSGFCNTPSALYPCGDICACELGGATPHHTCICLSERMLIIFFREQQLIIKCVSVDVCELRECVLAPPLPPASLVSPTKTVSPSSSSFASLAMNPLWF